MAYNGVAFPFFAYYGEDASGRPVYTGGGAVGRAVKYTISPQYFEDAREYTDPNDLDPVNEFSFAEVSLKTAEVDDPAMQALGHTVGADGFEMSDLDYAAPMGLGLIRTRVRSGTVAYEVDWLYKTILSDSGSETETRGTDINFDAPELSGRALPANDGRWRRAIRFEHRDDALAYLKQLVGYIEEE